MAKKYVVVAQGNLVDAELNTNDLEVATAQFLKCCETEDFYQVDLYDGETGEVYACQTREEDACGTAVTLWMAK